MGFRTGSNRARVLPLAGAQCLRAALRCAVAGLLGIGCMAASLVAKADEPRKFLRLDRDQAPPLALQASAGLWFTQFNRPERACGLTAAGTVRGGARCPASSSTEIVTTFEGTVRVHTVGPLYLGWGLGVGYSDPEFELLSPQTLILMPFTMTLTWPDWPVVPIVEGSVTAFVLLPDGLKSAMVGARAGLGIPIDQVLVGVSAGYAYADTFEPTEVRAFVSIAP